MKGRFTTMSWLVETGSDPENADMSNPTGARIEEVWGLIFELEDGRRYAPFGKITKEEAANVVGDWLDEPTSKALIAVAENNWYELEPVYGSARWLDPEAAYNRNADERSV